MLERPPLLLSRAMPQLIWRVLSSEKDVYLTFDDGPIPEVTPWVLDVLKRYDVKATFFCVGENVKKHENVYDQVLQGGHVVGNHTFNHLPYFKVRSKHYKANVEQAAKLIDSALFRPPHGQIGYGLSRWLRKKYKVVMWDILTADYDSTRSGEQCFAAVKNNIRPGSVIVFHDSIKAQKNMKEALPRTIEYLLKEGWNFKTLA